MFHHERAAMCYDAGRLVRVRYRAPHGLTMIEAVALGFEAGSWILAVNADDDTVRIVEGEEPGLEDVPTESPWACAVGTVPRWIWVLENQQGYHDGLQFCFDLDGEEVCQVQLMAMASSWHISLVHRWTPGQV